MRARAGAAQGQQQQFGGGSGRPQQGGGSPLDGAKELIDKVGRCVRGGRPAGQ